MAGYDSIPDSKWEGAGRQVILKEDFIAIETALLQAHGLIKAPYLSWVDNTSVKVAATADCASQILMSGFPNVLHPGSFISGGLSDGGYRTNTSDTTMDFDVAASFWGTEKASQWYSIYAIAGDADTAFTLKAIPWLRYSSQASQVITLRNNLNAADIGYGFTTDEFIDAKIFFISGSSKGLVRTITANNNNDATGGTITYSGAALTLTQGDWFIILPDTNFRWIGDIFNNASSHISRFERNGNRFDWYSYTQVANYAGGVNESPAVASPLATSMGAIANIGGGGLTVQQISNPNSDGTNNYVEIYNVTGAADQIRGFANITIQNCKYYVKAANAAFGVMYYEFPNGYL